MTVRTSHGDNEARPLHRDEGGGASEVAPGGGLGSVITLENFAEVPRGSEAPILAVGNFDGVHRGHTQLLGRLRAAPIGRGRRRWR